MSILDIPSAAEYIKSLGDAKKWDPVSKNGAQGGKLKEDVKAGFADGRFWIKFQFEEGGKIIVLEGSIGIDGREQVKLGAEA